MKRVPSADHGERPMPMTVALTLVLVLTACGSSTDTGGSRPPTTIASPTTTAEDTTDTTCSTVAEDACALDDDPLADPTGAASVTIGQETLEFEATRCLVGVDAFVIDGVTSDGSTTIAIRHASPPTRSEPQPSMSYLLIEPEPAFESAPASVGFTTYDPEAGTATGSVEEEVTFSVRCAR